MVPNTQNAARSLLILAGAVCAIGMVGPFQGVEANFVPADKAAHFIAFYGLTSLMMAAFPKNRRLEIALSATLLGGSIEIAQIFTHRGVSIFDLAADAAAGANPSVRPARRRRSTTDRWRSANCSRAGLRQFSLAAKARS